MQLKIDWQDWRTFPKDGREFLMSTSCGFMILVFDELDKCLKEVTFNELIHIDMTVKFLAWVDLPESPEA